MSKDRLSLVIEVLKLPEDTQKSLKMSGIDRLNDINTFTIKDLKQILGEEGFNHLLPTLRNYLLPSDLENLDLSSETIDVLRHAGVKNLKDLLNYDRHILYQTFETDSLLLKEINDTLTLYGRTELEVTVEPLFDDEEKSVEIDLEERIQKHVEPIRKGYGSRLYSHLKIRLASPNEIRQWSYGEVVNSETINYRTSKPENGGLFCERIFGPVRDYQCQCGKKQSGNKGQICNKCGVEITESKVRRERMGHIELGTPVVHTWYLKNTPSKLATLLGIKVKTLEEIIYYAAYIVVDPGNTSFVKRQVITNQEYRAMQEEFGNRFTALTGGAAIKKLLEGLDLDREIRILKRKFKTASKQKRESIIKRLDVVEAFRNSDNKPEWMVMDVIPVIPPDLRPMVALDGGRFATTDLNDLYRRIINRNNRLKKLMEIGAASLILNNERRMVQESVDSLIDNSKRGKRAVVERNRQLKSLSDLLRGKQGRFRQNLLGKRVDYSGRSVIIVGPDLEMYQCGIPREMAITLFKPFVLRELNNQFGYERKQNANNKYEKMDDDVWNALEKVVKEHPILLNRAPTLHRLGIQAFEPKLIDGKAIRLHPLVTPAFNADFDGDQMAIHVPLSNEAQAEARLLMLASNNILNPKDGKPIVTPSQDMILGNYYLTLENSKTLESSKYENEDDNPHRNEGHFYSSFEEANLAYENGDITLHTRIIVDPKSLKSNLTEDQKNKYLITTLGKLIFNQVLPDSFNYLNDATEYNLNVQTPDKFFVEKGQNPKAIIEKLPLSQPFKKKFLSLIITNVFRQMHISETSKMLDKIKALGFKYSTISGITVAASDIKVYSKKQEILDGAQVRLDEINEWFDDGLLTDEERKRSVITVWSETTESIKNDIIDDFEPDNNLFMIYDSGARGNISNFLQLFGMRGLLNNPKGDVIEVPVKGSFREGLSVAEFFISTHGARKGSTDTALKTAESGYLTRRLVDVSQDLIIVEDDCKTEKGRVVSDILKEEKGQKQVVVPLIDRIIGRYAARDIENSKGKLLASRNDLITEELAETIINEGIKEVEIRSAFSCNSENGICSKCYGRNLSTNTEVEVGEAVGVVAAQSIGEPGTQLTMRTFHTGGVASASDITQGLPRIQELFEARDPKGRAVISEVNGKVKNIESLRSGLRTVIIVDNEGKEHKYPLDASVDPIVTKNQKIQVGEKLTEGPIWPAQILKTLSTEEVQSYLLEEVQKVYRAQGVEISDKHIEIVVRQMMRRIYVVVEGDTNLLPGTEVSINEFKRENKKALEEGKRLAVGRPILLGITRASLRSESFLSAASFQETTRILTDAAITGKTDELHGLKENVIIGGLIPAGTGILNEKLFSYNNPEAHEEEDFEYEDY